MDMVMMLTMIELTMVEMMTVTLLGVVMMLMMIVATNLKGRERAEQDRKKGGN